LILLAINTGAYLCLTAFSQLISARSNFGCATGFCSSDRPSIRLFSQLILKATGALAVLGLAMRMGTMGELSAYIMGEQGNPHVF
jgi:hypothetical protein